MRSVSKSVRPPVAAGTAVVLSALVAACGGSTSRPAGSAPAATVDPAALLRRSRAVVDAATAVHFVLSSTDVRGSGAAILGGSGDLVRPDELQGSFSVQVSGLNASVGVIETGGRFYALPPFASHYSITNPAAYGLGDPAQLLSPTTGVSSLLTAIRSPRSTGRQRISGELVDVITGTVPGSLVPVLPDLARSRPVTVTAAVDPATAQLRQVSLIGPFTSATATTTYTVALTAYDEHVTITAPRT